MSTENNYAYSEDGECFHGSYATEQEAIVAGFEDNALKTIWVGIGEPPRQPEEFVEASDVLDLVLNQDEYCGQWSQDWPDMTTEQEVELTDTLQKTVADWLDKHNLRPTFFMVNNAREVSRPADMPIDPDNEEE